MTPTLTAATRRFTGDAASRPVATSQSNASMTATHAPVIDAVRVPPSATQHVAIELDRVLAELGSRRASRECCGR